MSSEQGGRSKGLDVHIFGELTKQQLYRCRDWSSALTAKLFDTFKMLLQFSFFLSLGNRASYNLYLDA